MVWAVGLVAALGVINTGSFALVMIPQVVLNLRQRSTEGLSVSMILLWHAGTLLNAAFFLADYLGPISDASAPSPADSSLWLFLSIVVVTLEFCILEAQVVAYRPQAGADTTLKTRRGCRCSASTIVTLLAMPTISAGSIWGFCFWMRSTTSVAAYWVGNVLPTVILAVGFAPQIHVFIKTKSIEGFSFGVSFLDVTGSVAAIALVFAPEDLSPGEAMAVAIPFITIISCQFVLVFCAMLVTCCRGNSEMLPVLCKSAEGCDGEPKLETDIEIQLPAQGR